MRTPLRPGLRGCPTGQQPLASVSHTLSSHTRGSSFWSRPDALKRRGRRDRMLQDAAYVSTSIARPRRLACNAPSQPKKATGYGILSTCCLTCQKLRALRAP